MMRKILDVHVHIGSDGYKIYTPEQAIEKMDNIGIEKAVLSPIPNYELPCGIASSRQQNDAIAAALKQYPDRFVRGLGVVDPRHGEAAVPEVDRVFSELGLHGLLFSNDYTGLTLDNPTMIKFMERASSYKNPVVLAYTSQYSVLQAPFMLRKVAERFPNIVFINASSMKDTTHSNSSRYLSASLPNVYMDITNIHQLMHPIEWAVNESGANKIMFGSGIPYTTFCPEIMMVDAADITEDDRHAIYWGNAAKVFGIS